MNCANCYTAQPGIPITLKQFHPTATMFYLCPGCVNALPNPELAGELFELSKLAACRNNLELSVTPHRKLKTA